jgi:single-stranded-DNA-specific exonuclease
MKLAQALLERRDLARTREKTLPSFLKMAAIATIADAVPLKGENRVIAALGFRELRNPAGAGLRALFAAAALDPAAKPITGFDVAFRLAPRINAAGRMDVASEVVELFTTRDLARAAELAAKLERLNRERRETEATALTAIEARLATDEELAADRLLLVDGDGWHRGVIGILASRVVERTAKPAIVVSVEDGVAQGSGRSVDGFHLLNALESCADLFTRFGGHAFAVGFALPAESCPSSSAACASTPKNIWPPASRSTCCVFTPSCRWTASPRCSWAGCASWNPSATATPSRSLSPAACACWPRRAS